MDVRGSGQVWALVWCGVGTDVRRGSAGAERRQGYRYLKIFCCYMLNVTTFLPFIVSAVLFFFLVQ